MPEKAIETENLDIPDTTKQTCGLTVWVDYHTMKDLELIAAYERMKRGPLMRMIMVEKIKVYKRNPAFKRFLTQLQRTQEADKSQ